jgi:hypothetical protein
MNDKTILVLCITFGVFFSIFGYFFTSSRDSVFRQEYLNLNINSLVNEIKWPNKGRPCLLFKMNNGQDFTWVSNEREVDRVFSLIHNGDSLTKLKGSLIIYIYRNNYLTDSFSYVCYTCKEDASNAPQDNWTAPKK